ncbi:MAG: hypothetical protein AAF399_26350, partial [Bacteroidota bacterium]
EARIAAEPEVREAVLLRKMERAAVQQLIAKDLRAKMKTWQAEKEAMPESTQPSSSIRPLWIGGLVAAAAAVALLLWVIFTPSQDPLALPEEGEFAEQPQLTDDSAAQMTPTPNEANKLLTYVEQEEQKTLDLFPTPLANNIRGAETSEEEDLSEQIKASAEAKNWTHLINLLKTVSSSDSTYQWVQEELPKAYGKVGQFAMAAQGFQTLKQTNNNNVSLRQEYEWYLLLSWRLAGPNFYSQADSLLAIVQSSQHNYAPNAAALFPMQR